MEVFGLSELRTVRGMRDLMGPEILVQDYLIETAVTLFRQFGYEHLDSPAMELWETLSAKGGEEVEAETFKFTDKGVGMSREVMKKLYDPFFTTKEVGEGIGLDMAMVYGIIRQSGGDIQVYSQRGQGTTFEIYLPRANDVDATDGKKGGC